MFDLRREAELYAAIARTQQPFSKALEERCLSYDSMILLCALTIADAEYLDQGDDTGWASEKELAMPDWTQRREDLVFARVAHAYQLSPRAMREHIKRAQRVVERFYTVHQ